MANATPSRLGQINLAGDNRAIFLKVFAGEVMTTFNTKTVMKDLTKVRSISSGKSASFPTIGNTSAAYHTAGSEITGNPIAHGEKIITIDDLLIAHTAIAAIDEAMNHYDVRSEYSRQLGDALAQTYDRNLLSLAVKAARDTGAGGIGVGAPGQGNAFSAAIGATPTTDQVIAAAFAAAERFDTLNIPEEGRKLLVGPAWYYKLVQAAEKLINKDFNGANGSFADGKVRVIAGFEIVKTNNLSLDHTATANTNKYPDYASKYAVNASDTVGVFYHPDALGTVKLMELATESEWDMRRQVTLMLAKMALGHGVLRPECIYEIRAVAP